MQVVNGYELNEPGEPSDWSPREFANLSAFATLLPPAGTKDVTVEHFHDRLGSASTVQLDSMSGGFLTVGGGLFLPDDEKISLGNSSTTPDCKEYSNGTNILRNFAGSVKWIVSTCAGDIEMNCVAGGDIKFDAASGHVLIDGNDYLLLQSQGHSINLTDCSGGIIITSDMDVQIIADDDVRIVAVDATIALGDNAGANTLKVLDSDGDTELTVDSNGNLSAAGNVLSNGPEWEDISLSVTIDGWSATPAPTVMVLRKRLTSNFVLIDYLIYGTSNAANAAIQLVDTIKNTVGHESYIPCFAKDANTQIATAHAYLTCNTAWIQFIKAVGASWTDSGIKQVSGQFCYETT